ncbi:hypothetical protein VitviT2T_011751 [Vitis vinifera]|uniref:Protein SCO1-like 1, mitochondrial n=2 Tax=Vitis vinifera TaxID=29760 RepID=D7SY28_VITVI|eukprot:XP_002263427.1 PREDICTED: protein SCO1 homolog 1, mitochondrial isoform X1 [Vitis vinifera]
MANFASRSAQLRYFRRYLCSRALNQCSSTQPSPPLKFCNHFSSQSIMPLRPGIQTLMMHHRYLCGTAGKSDSGEGQKSDQSSDAGKAVRGGPVSWLSFLLLIFTGAGLVFYYDNEKKRHIEEINASSTAVKEGPSAGKAAIGGPFNLINDEGKNVTEKDFFGKWTLIYFGFTHCPDICPDELIKVADAVDKIKAKIGVDIVPVFISVDPERDTVEQVHEYVKEFHPNLIGLTGNPDEVRKAARAYRVYYMKTEEEGSDYLVDHSIMMYLMGPKMDFVKNFGKNNDVDSLANGIMEAMKKYKP